MDERTNWHDHTDQTATARRRRRVAVTGALVGAIGLLGIVMLTARPGQPPVPGEGDTVAAAPRPVSAPALPVAPPATQPPAVEEPSGPDSEIGIAVAPEPSAREERAPGETMGTPAETPSAASAPVRRGAVQVAQGIEPPPPPRGQEVHGRNPAPPRERPEPPRERPSERPRLREEPRATESAERARRAERSRSEVAQRPPDVVIYRPSIRAPSEEPALPPDVVYRPSVPSRDEERVRVVRQERARRVARLEREEQEAREARMARREALERQRERERERDRGRRPGGERSARICVLTGELAAPFCPSTAMMVAPIRELPRERCGLHRKDWD
jgi:hypothetical protein